jgi:acetyl-CoA carboxylase, biotin carboxylase subunit
MVQPGGPGIREDCAVFAGWTVPLDYDPMLSKLVAFAPTREMAIDRMLRALDEYVIGGIKTNIELFRRILTDEDFRAARIDTGYLERLLAVGGKLVEEDAPEDVVALAAALFVVSTRRETALVTDFEVDSRWAEAGRREGLRL